MSDNNPVVRVEYDEATGHMYIYRKNEMATSIPKEAIAEHGLWLIERIKELELSLAEKEAALEEARQLYADAKERIKYLESITHKQGTKSDYFNYR